jgi:hypothetical protein
MTERDDRVDHDHPEVDRAYDRAEGGDVPDEQTDYQGPDPEADPKGDREDEDQGT